MLGSIYSIGTIVFEFYSAIAMAIGVDPVRLIDHIIREFPKKIEIQFKYVRPRCSDGSLDFELFELIY